MGHRSLARRTGTGIVSVRVVVAVVLAAAVCMLVLPDAASAKVDRKYAVPYRTGLASLVTHNRTEVRAFNAYATDMAETSRHIASILESPRRQGRAGRRARPREEAARTSTST